MEEKESNITEELCEELSKLSIQEWSALKALVDEDFQDQRDAAWQEFVKSSGLVTIDKTGPELAKRARDLVVRSAGTSAAIAERRQLRR